MAGKPISSFNSIAKNYSRTQLKNEQKTVKTTGKLEGLSQRERATRGSQMLQNQRTQDSFIDTTGARVWKGRGT